MLNNVNGNFNLDDEVDDTLNSLFKSTMNIDVLKSQIKNSYNTMKSSDFNLEKELAQTKLNININEISYEDKYLKKRIWNSSDDNKIQYLETKVNEVYKKIDQKKVKNLIEQINKCDLNRFYNNFRPKCNDKTIGSISSLDFLIETTYNTNANHYDNMIIDRADLNPYIYKFRSVLGDGDCFYRGFIFSFLENIILTNNIMLMKELLKLYYEKINLENKLIKDKEYLLIFHEMNIDIVTRVLYILIYIMENDIKKAYIYLLKLFLYCPDFDFGIIYFTRYLIYEYISANENKIYSREFQVEVGCLLPETYCIDKGNKNEYLFEDYFSMNLMKTKTFAEKIVIYLTPFVFNVNMNILIYDFGINGAPSSIQEKKFLSDNDTSSQIQINLLFRKAHYDIYYKQNYFEKYKIYFNILENTKEDIQIINKSKKELLEEEEKKKALKMAENDQNLIKNNKNDLTICLECKKPYNNILNEFFLCDQCLLNNIKTAFLLSYMEFIKNKTNMINAKENLKLLESKTFFNSEIQGTVSIRNALNNSKFKFDDIFLEIRKGLCLNCGKNLKGNNDYFIKLPCECRICTQKCFFDYVETLKRILNLYNRNTQYLYVKVVNFLECFCGYFYHSFDVFYMIDELGKRKLKKQKEFYQDYIKLIWIWRCMICLNPFENNHMFYRVIFDTDKFDKNILKSKKDLKHLLCNTCREKLNNDKVIFCRICEFEHQVSDIVEVDAFNEEDSCIIF